MTPRCCIFVDGENLRHTICELFATEFQKEDYLPKQARWADLFMWLARRAIPDCHLIRTYWYVVQHVDFSPYRLPKPDKAKSAAEKQGKESDLKRILCKHQPYASALNRLTGDQLRVQMKGHVGDLKRRRVQMQNRFNGWTTLQNGIVAKHDLVEFRRAGSIRYDLFTGSLGTEKAVDVKLATDLILLCDIYDAAVVVSGDQDYVPAVQAVKDLGKRVVNVAFKTRRGKLLPGGAWRLNLVTDRSIAIDHVDLKCYLNLGDPACETPPDSGSDSESSR